MKYIIFFLIGLFIKNIADKRGHKITFLYPLISMVFTPIFAFIFLIIKIVYFENKKDGSSNNQFKEKNHSELISINDFEEEELSEELKEKIESDENYKKFEDLPDNVINEYKLSSNPSNDEYKISSKDFNENNETVELNEEDEYKESPNNDLTEENSYNEYSYSFGNESKINDEYKEIDNSSIADYKNSLEKKESISLDEDNLDINQKIANKYFEILKKRMKKSNLLQEYSNKSDLLIITKGKYEIGKEKDDLLTLLLSRKEFLDDIQKKFENYNQEKLIREIDIFNNFEAEIESVRRKEVV